MRILLACLVALTAFAVLPPTASATCLDTAPDDDGVGTEGCDLPAGGDCKVLVYGSLPGIGSGCVPIVCVKECVPYDCVQDCDGTPASTSSAASPSSQQPPCQVSSDPLAGDLSATCPVSFCEAGPVVEDGRYDHAVSCESFIHCVTEPCPGSGRIEV